MTRAGRHAARPALALAAVLGLAVSAARPLSAAVRVTAEPVADVRPPTGLVALSVHVEGDGVQRELVVEARQTRIRAPTITRVPVRLAAGGRKRLPLVVVARRGSDTFVVEATEGGTPLAAATVSVAAIPETAPLVGVLGPAPFWLRVAAREGPGFAVAELAPDRLPASALAWPSVDVIVWPAPRPADLGPARALALFDWVRRGGRLVAGRSAEEPEALRSLLPAERRDRLAVLPAANRVGLGRMEIVEEDLTRRAPPSGAVAWPAPPDPSSVRSAGSWILKPWSSHLVAITREERTPPRAPVLSAAAIFVAFALLTVPLEHRLARRGGRRPLTGAATRRLAVTAAAVTATWLLVGRLGDSASWARRIDVMDVDPASGTGRAVSLLVFERAERGRFALEAPRSAQLRPLAPTPPRWHRRRERLAEPDVVEAGGGPSGLRTRAGLDAASWTARSALVEWPVAPAVGRRAAELAAAAGAGVTGGARGDAMGSWVGLHRLQRRHADDPGRLLLRLAAELSALDGARGAADPLAWRGGGAPTVSLIDADLGPRLELDGRPVPPARWTLVRTPPREGVAP